MSEVSYEPGAAIHAGEAVAAGAALVFLAGLAVYVFGSFLLMGRHVGRRHYRQSLRELGRELWIAGLTQPILPLCRPMTWCRQRSPRRPWNWWMNRCP